MADFVLSEAEVEDNVCNDMSVASEERESDREFIDDTEYCNEVINCYFSNKINLAFSSTYIENGILRHGTAFQCHFCSNYYGRKDKHDRQFDSCTGKLKHIYNFNTQS